jgi:hypothetical protein
VDSSLNPVNFGSGGITGHEAVGKVRFEVSAQIAFLVADAREQPSKRFPRPAAYDTVLNQISRTVIVEGRAI